MFLGINNFLANHLFQNVWILASKHFSTTWKSNRTEKSYCSFVKDKKISPPSFGETGLSVGVAADKPVFLTPESLENHSAQATFNVFICDCLWAHTYASGVRVVNFRWKLGFKSWPGHIVVLLGITCYSHRTTLYPGENSYHQIIRLNEMLRG